jgi:hypothetical protein
LGTSPKKRLIGADGKKGEEIQKKDS